MTTTLRDSPLESAFVLVGVSLVLDTNPGIGIELETGGVVMNNFSEKAKKPTAEEQLKVKGAPFKIVDNERANALCRGPNWHVTAEYEGTQHTDGIVRLRPEFIIYGERVKLGTGQLEVVGNEIVTFMVGIKSNLHSICYDDCAGIAPRTELTQMPRNSGDRKVTRRSRFADSKISDHGSSPNPALTPLKASFLVCKSRLQYRFQQCRGTSLGRSKIHGLPANLFILTAP